MWLRNDCALTECYKKYDQLIVVWIICRYTNEFSVLLYLLQYLCEYTSECHSVPQLLRHLYLTDITYLYTFHCCAIYSSNIKCYACLMFLLILFLNKHVKLYWFLLYQSIPVFCCWSSTKFFPMTEIKNSCHWFNMKETSKVDKR